MHCFNFNITGGGSATPKGATFPGAYTADAPGLHWDIFTPTNKTFPPVGPALYKPIGPKPILEARRHVVISPTGGNATADDAYYKVQNQVLAEQVSITQFFDAIGG